MFQENRVIGIDLEMVVPQEKGKSSRLEHAWMWKTYEELPIDLAVSHLWSLWNSKTMRGEIFIYAKKALILKKHRVALFYIDGRERNVTIYKAELSTAVEDCRRFGKGVLEICLKKSAEISKK